MVPPDYVFDKNMDHTISGYINDSYPQVRSVLITLRGEVTFEQYYQGLSRDSYHHSASITKTFTSALVGVAINHGFIDSLDRLVTSFFPEYATDQWNCASRQMTLKHLLTMTTGLGWVENDSGAWDKHQDLTELFFELPSACIPGQTFNYNTLSTHLLSTVLSRISGMSLLDFAERYLFRPMDIAAGEWSKDLKGNAYGGHSAHFRTLDLAKLGNLYLNKGIWKGKRVLAANFVAESTRRQNGGGFPENCGYGYLWWTTSTNGHSAYFAAGYGGQYVYVVDDLSLVIVVTSNRDRPHPENRGLIERFVIPTFTNDGSAI